MILNKKIVLTGGNSGIGYEVVKILANEPTNTILVVDKDDDNLKGFGENVISLKLDISSKEAVDIVFETATKLFGKIDIFYANAGYPYYEIFDYTDWDRVKVMFETNVFSPIYSYSKFREHLNGQKGTYAITVSAIGQMAMPGFAVYSASKFAVEGFQQSLRLEHPDNIQLTCLYPIATDTNFFKAANDLEFDKPFPVQKPSVVAKKMVKGMAKGKKCVYPSTLFSFAKQLMKFLPFIKTIYWKMEKSKLEKFEKKLKEQEK